MEKINSLQSCLLPELGHTLYSADFKQCELRVLAVMAQDATLSSILASGRDLLIEVASRLFKTPVDQVTKAQRTKAKAAVYGIVYGQTPYGLSQAQNISESEAQEIQDQLWLVLPGVKKFIQDTHTQARLTKKVSTFHGRIRDLAKEIRSDFEYAMRLAVNHRVQSTAADLMRIALINLDRKLRLIGGRVLLSRHDELVFSVPATVPASQVYQLTHAAMVLENDPHFNLAIDLEMGDRWGDTMQPVAPPQVEATTPASV